MEGIQKVKMLGEGVIQRCKHPRMRNSGNEGMFGEWLGWSNRSGSGKGESRKERRGMVGAGRVTQGFACLAKEPGLCRPKRTNEVSGQGSKRTHCCVLPRLLWQRHAPEQMHENGSGRTTGRKWQNPELRTLTGTSAGAGHGEGRGAQWPGVDWSR